MYPHQVDTNRTRPAPKGGFCTAFHKRCKRYILFCGCGSSPIQGYTSISGNWFLFPISENSNALDHRERTLPVQSWSPDIPVFHQGALLRQLLKESHSTVDSDPGVLESMEVSQNSFSISPLIVPEPMVSIKRTSLLNDGNRTKYGRCQVLLKKLAKK